MKLMNKYVLVDKLLKKSIQLSYRKKDGLKEMEMSGPELLVKMNVSK
jgi:hypothetical protein